MNNRFITIDEFHKLAHEVKNPLALCKGYLKLLEKDKTNNHNYLNIIKQELDRSLIILTNYMVFNKEEIDLNLLLEEIVELINPYFNKNNCKIILIPNNKEYYIHTDYNKLKQIIINLIKNSYESQSLSKLIIVIEIISKKNNYLIKITDNGKGMSSRTLKNICKKKYTTKKDGHGLGITYIKDNLNRMGGSVKYYSKENIGTRVEILLPKKSPKTFNNNSYCWNK